MFFFLKCKYANISGFTYAIHFNNQAIMSLETNWHDFEFSDMNAVYFADRNFSPLLIGCKTQAGQMSKLNMVANKFSPNLNSKPVLHTEL